MNPEQEQLELGASQEPASTGQATAGSEAVSAAASQAVSRAASKSRPERKPPAPYSWLWLFVSAAVVWGDMETKAWASEVLTLYRPQEVLSWFNLTLAHNYGAAFSFLSDAGGWQRWFFTIMASIVSLVLIVWVLRLPRREWLTGLALALVIGGAIGNLVDRVQLGYVVDFIDLHYQGWHFPAFNVADSAISCGLVLLILDAVLQTWREKNRAE